MKYLKKIYLFFVIVFSIILFTECSSNPIPPVVCQYGNIVCEYSGLLCQVYPESCRWIGLACLNLNALCDTTLSEAMKEFHLEQVQLASDSIKNILSKKVND